MKTALLTSFKQNESNNALGQIIRKEGQPDTIKYITYGELNSQSIEYSVPVTDKKPGESPVFRNPLYKEGLIEGPTPQIK